MRLRFRQLLFVLLLGVFPLATEASGQGSIEGTLIDSLRTMRPLAAAEVVLLSDGRSAKTDQRGRFRFDNVPAGTQRVGYGALWLDSLAAPAVVVSTTVGERGRSRVVLATLPRQTAQLAACGTELPDELGLLVGEVRDASSQDLAEAVVVEARWSERLLGRDLNQTREMATVDTTDGAGRYALCGVPLNVEVTVRSRHPDGRAIEPLVVEVDVPVVARDFSIGATDRVFRVRGRVAGLQGVSMPRATVLASLDQSRPVTTDSTGVFSFTLPARSGQLFVRALGYRPRLVSVAPVEDEVDVGDVELVPVDAVLDTVRIVASRPRTLEEIGFEERRQMGLGAFIDEATLLRMPRITATNIAHQTPGWARTSQGTIPIILVRRGPNFCRPLLFVDGVSYGNDSEAIDEYNLLQIAVRVEIYQANFAPPRFTDFSGCGALVIWTR